jgi:hypothetical protein
MGILIARYRILTWRKCQTGNVNAQDENPNSHKTKIAKATISATFITKMLPKIDLESFCTPFSITLRTIQ